MSTTDPRTTRPLEYVRAHGGAIVAAWLFPLLCWAAATLYLGGALGKSTDDYSINLRDPVTYAVPSPFNPLHRYPYFWRPLHNILCFGVGTLFPGADRSVHIAVAIFHGLSRFGLYLLLRKLTRTRLAPALAALVFMALPLNSEVAFWFCTTSTAIGTALFAIVGLLTVRFARAEFYQPRLLALIAAVTFVVTCFYEQSAAPVAALPAICLAVAPAWQRWRDRILRAILVTAAAGAACIIYVGLLISTAPRHVRGGSDSLVTTEHTATRLAELLQGIHNCLFGDRARQIVRGSWDLGWETVSTPRGLVAGATLLAAGSLWLIWATRRGGGAAHSEQDVTPPRHAWTFVAGAIMFIASWIPVYVVERQGVELRLTYVPLLGIAVMFGAMLDAFLWATGSAIARAIVTIIAIAGISAGTVCLIGSQSFFQRRSAQDRREIATLKELVPDPPLNTIFVPFRTNATAVLTGNILFDRGRHGIFETPWSGHAALRFIYRREDLSATACNPWVPIDPIDKPGVDGVRWTRGMTKEHEKLFPKDPEGGRRIPWTNMVPFVTEPDGQVRLIRRVDVERADHRDLEIRPPLVRAAEVARKGHAGRAVVPTTTYQIIEGNSDTRLDLIPIKFWELGDSTPVKFQDVRPWAARSSMHQAAWLAASTGPHERMSVQMPPLDRPEYLLIRATMVEYDLDPARNPIAAVQELVVTMASAPDKELATLKLDPANLQALKKWLPLVVTLPARAAPAGDRIVISLRRTADPPVRTDPANRTPIPADTRGAILPVWVTHGYEQAIIPIAE